MVENIFCVFSLPFQPYQIDRHRRLTARRACQSTATSRKNSWKSATRPCRRMWRLPWDCRLLTPTITRTLRSFCCSRACSSSLTSSKSSTFHPCDSENGFMRSTSTTMTFLSTTFGTASVCRKWWVFQHTKHSLIENGRVSTKGIKIMMRIHELHYISVK